MPKTEGKCKLCGNPAKKVKFQGSLVTTHLFAADTKRCKSENGFKSRK